MCCARFYLDCLCLQGTFIVFQDKVKPGKNFTGSQLFDTGGAFYNMPGYLDNLKVGCMFCSCFRYVSAFPQLANALSCYMCLQSARAHVRVVSPATFAAS